MGQLVRNMETKMIMGLYHEYCSTSAFWKVGIHHRQYRFRHFLVKLITIKHLVLLPRFHRDDRALLTAC